MADRLSLEVTTPMRLVVAELVDEVVAPGIEGYFGVLPGHASFLTTLGIGELTYRKGRDEYHLAVAGGFAEVRNDKVIVLADAAEQPKFLRPQLRSRFQDNFAAAHFPATQQNVLPRLGRLILDLHAPVVERPRSFDDDDRIGPSRDRGPGHYPRRLQGSDRQCRRFPSRDFFDHLERAVSVARLAPACSSGTAP